LIIHFSRKISVAIFYLLEYTILKYRSKSREGRVHAGARGSEPEEVKVRHPLYVESHPPISQ